MCSLRCTCTCHNVTYWYYKATYISERLNPFLYIRNMCVCVRYTGLPGFNMIRFTGNLQDVHIIVIQYHVIIFTARQWLDNTDTLQYVHSISWLWTTGHQQAYIQNTNVDQIRHPKSSHVPLILYIITTLKTRVGDHMAVPVHIECTI